MNLDPFPTFTRTMDTVINLYKWRFRPSSDAFHIPFRIPRIFTINANKIPIKKYCMSIFSSSTLGPLYYHELTLISAWIFNHMSSEVWGEITYSFPNFNGAAVEVWELMINFKF